MTFRNISTVFFAGLLALLVIGAGLFLLTENGSSFLVRQWLLRATFITSLKVKEARGNLLQGLCWKGVVVEARGDLPPGFAVDIGEIDLSRVFSLNRNVAFQNARFGFPGNPSVLSFDGVCSASRCSLDIKTHRMKISAIVGLLSQQRFRPLDPKFLRPLKLVPEGQVSAQNISLSFTRGRKPELKVNIFNGRLVTKGSDTILFGGEYQDNALNLNVYTKAIAVSQVLAFFPAKARQWKLAGSVADVDLNLSGKLAELRISGDLTLEKVLREGRAINNAHCHIQLQTLISGALELRGTVEIKDGTVSGPNAADVHLKPSRIVFRGDVAKAGLDLKGRAEVARTRIDIALKGTFDKPELKLESDPQLPQEQLLAMLLTNRGWGGTETSLGQGKVNVNAANEFVNFLLLGSRGGDVLRALGIKDVTVTAEKTKRGVGVTKELTGNLDANYAFEQTLDAATGLSTAVQRIGGDLRLNDAFSVEAEREMRLRGALDTAPDSQPQSADKILLKYRRTF